MTPDELKSALERLDALLLANPEPGTASSDELDEQIKLIEKLERFLEDEDHE